MSRKKRQQRAKKSRGRQPARPPAERMPALPDPRAMEGTMRNLVRELSGRGAADTPLERAQTRIEQAFEEADEQRRVQLAQEALALCPDCADAYVLLAEQAGSRKEALTLFEQGVAAGERALGPEAFQEAAGHFWGLLETRPYMRARFGLANVLWALARRDEAITHL